MSDLYVVHPDREQHCPRVGISIRAKRNDGTYGHADLAHLTEQSLLHWGLDSGPDIVLGTLLCILGHKRPPQRREGEKE